MIATVEEAWLFVGFAGLVCCVVLGVVGGFLHIRRKRHPLNAGWGYGLMILASLCGLGAYYFSGINTVATMVFAGTGMALALLAFPLIGSQHNISR